MVILSVHINYPTQMVETFRVKVTAVVLLRDDRDSNIEQGHEKILCSYRG